MSFFRRHLISFLAGLALLASLPAFAQEVVLARVEGLWCGTGLLREFSLRLSQRYQEVQGSLARRDRVRAIEGRVEGATVRTQATRHGSLVLELSGDELKVTGGEGALALARGAAFQRASGTACNG